MKNHQIFYPLAATRLAPEDAKSELDINSLRNPIMSLFNVGLESEVEALQDSGFLVT